MAGQGLTASEMRDHLIDEATPLLRVADASDPSSTTTYLKHPLASTTPLSPENNDDDDDVGELESFPLLEIPPTTLRGKVAAHFRTWVVFYMLFLAIFVLTLGVQIRLAALPRFTELMVCRQYYLKHDPSLIDEYGNVAEELCKIRKIQDDFAMLRGWTYSATSLTSFLFAIPWGAAADIIGRKPVLALSLFGITLGMAWELAVAHFWLTLSPYWIIAKASTALIGGGTAVLNATLTTVLTDIVTPEKRTVWFMYYSAAGVLNSIMGPFIGLVLVNSHGVWIPQFVCLAGNALCILIIMLMPETLPASARRVLTTEEQAMSFYKRSKDSGVHAMKKVVALAKVFRQDGALLSAVPIMICLPLARELLDVLKQYFSLTQNWSLEKTSILDAYRSALTGLLYIVLAPLINQLLLRRLNYKTDQADLLFSKVSMMILICGLVILSLGKTTAVLLVGLGVMSFGWGVENTVILYCTSRVSSTQIAILYTFGTMLDAAGMSTLSPALAWLFTASSNVPFFGRGFVFMVTGVVVLVCSLGLFCVGVGNRPKSEIVDAVEESRE